MRYPLTITNLSGRVAVVVGGGIVGERKVRSLLAADVPVRLISPSATEQLTAWAEGGEIEWTRRLYREGDLDDAGLVFAATNVRAVNHEIAVAAHRQALLVNVADAPARGKFPLGPRSCAGTILLSPSARSPGSRARPLPPATELPRCWSLNCDCSSA